MRTMVGGAVLSPGVKPPTTILPPGARPPAWPMSSPPATSVITVPPEPNVESSSAESPDAHADCVPAAEPGLAMIVPLIPTAQLLALSAVDAMASRPLHVADVCGVHVV